MSGDIIKHQKQALVHTIREAQRREDQRLKKLSNVHSKTSYQQLSERYDRERQLEQQKIENLRNDLVILHRKRSEGELNIPVDDRKNAQREAYRLNNSQHQTSVSRFYGMENLSDILFRADITKKFEKHDQKFMAECAKVNYNPIDDIKRLRLLGEKRQVLEKLIRIQQAESNQNSRSRFLPSNDTRSIYSGGATSTSGVSYATFASDNMVRFCVQNNERASKGVARVPKLALGSL